MSLQIAFTVSETSVFAEKCALEMWGPFCTTLEAARKSNDMHAIQILGLEHCPLKRHYVTCVGTFHATCTPAQPPLLSNGVRELSLEAHCERLVWQWTELFVALKTHNTSDKLVKDGDKVYAVRCAVCGGV